MTTDKYLIEEMFSSTENFITNFEYFMQSSYGKSIEESSKVEKYMVLGRMINSYALSKWKKTGSSVRKNHNKRVYYFSLEFLMGRMMSNNLLSMGIEGVVKDGLNQLGIDINEIEDVEADAGLGNGGLGRLAACFLDSLATLEYGGNSNTIRYLNGLFKQLIVNNEQVEVPDQWLRMGYPWEVKKPDHAVTVRFYGNVDVWRDEKGDLQFRHVNTRNVLAVPYDMPIIGADSDCTNTLRMWSAEAADDFPHDISYPEYLADVSNLCLNLYPEDYSEAGKHTRIKQEYFFVAAGLHTIVREHLRYNPSLDNLAEQVVIQLNDTHPALAIPELMRILMDEYSYSWDAAYSICNNVFAYTNHTVLSEALEKWPVAYIKLILPRIYLIIEEIERQFVTKLRAAGYGEDFISSVRIIHEGNVRMAYLSIIGSFSVNGVAKIHSDILINGIFANFYKIYPHKFNNKTNGITQRRWFLYSNRELAKLVEEYIGPDFRKDFTKISALMNHVDNVELQEKFMAVKRAKKVELAAYLKQYCDVELDPDSIFDVQAKRLHAYKRQLLNVMYIISLYFRIKDDPSFTMEKTTFIFGAKAAGNYYFAKKVIKLINRLAEVIDGDEQVSRFIKVVFIPNYSVSVAEKLMPAADISEQISTAGKEASGTGNMKFMMNGAITLGTMDGANVEIREQVTDDNIVIFGLSADEVKNLKPVYNAYGYYQTNPLIRRIIDSFRDGTWSDDYNDFADIANEFLNRNDEYMLLADFDSYCRAHDEIYKLYQDRHAFAKKCLINTAKSAYFSSDRTIEDYVQDIWHLQKIEL